MIFSALVFLDVLFKKLRFFEPENDFLGTDPDKETTFCIVPLGSSRVNIGSTLEYFEMKGFKLVGLKTIQGISSISMGLIHKAYPSIVMPSVVLAIQGKNSAAMVYNYIQHAVSYRTASPMACPATAPEAREAIGWLFGPGELHSWERSADWWIVRENC